MKQPVVKAATEAGCHPGTVDRYIRARRLEVEWDRGRRLVDVERLRAILREPPRRVVQHEAGLP